MKTSPSQQKVRVSSFSGRAFWVAALLYSPIVIALFWTTAPPSYKPAGQVKHMVLTLTQLSALSSAPSDAMREQKTSERTPAATMPAERAAPKSLSEPKVKVKPQTPKARRLSPATPRNAVSENVAVAASDTRISPKEVSPTAPTVAPSASDQKGISTLVYGEIDDPFLTRVKTAVEQSLRYPRKALRFGIEGTTVVQFIIGGDGRVNDMQIYRSAGHPLLDKTALQAVSLAQPRWGKPDAEVRLRFPIEFNIKRR